MQGEKAPRRIYLVHRLSVPSDKVDEFNKYWKENTLPRWNEWGAKLIVAGTNIVGGPSHEITRIYELENLAHYARLQEATWDWWEREGGPARTAPPPSHLNYLTTLESRIMRAVYPDI